MGNRHTQLGEHLALFLRDVRAMRHDRAFVHQAEITKRIRVGFPKTLQHHIVLPLALVTMGLHVGARRSRKVAQAAQHFIGAARNEARRDNWPNALLARAANGFDFLNKRCRVGDSLRRRSIAIIFGIRSRVVHDRFADKCALAFFGANRRELDARFQMRASQIHRGRRAACEQSVHEVAVHAAREFHIRELRFQGKRALFEPQIQRFIERKRGLGPLRSVNVNVHETGQPETPLPQLYEHVAIAIGLKKVTLARVVVRHDAHDDAIAINLDKRVFQILEFAIHGSMEKRAIVRAFHFLRHETPRFIPRRP